MSEFAIEADYPTEFAVQMKEVMGPDATQAYGDYLKVRTDDPLGTPQAAKKVIEAINSKPGVEEEPWYQAYQNIVVQIDAQATVGKASGPDDLLETYISNNPGLTAHEINVIKTMLHLKVVAAGSHD